MQTFDNTRPLVAGMAVGRGARLPRAHRELLAEAGVEVDYDRPAHAQSAAAAELLDLEAEYEAVAAADAGGRVDGRQLEAQLAAGLDGEGEGRAAPPPRSRCAASRSAARVGYGEDELLEKWARDAKILDIFEGTQQIQLLIIARQLLGKTSAELEVAVRGQPELNAEGDAP